MRIPIFVEFNEKSWPVGRSVIEAMAMHVPVVVTGDDTGFIRHGVNGLFFRKFDPKVDWKFNYTASR